jgi:DNA polymerase III epsilon subunit family exonuclease
VNGESMFCEVLALENVASELRGKTEFVSLDIETTGLSPKSARIIEIGAVRFNGTGKITKRLSSIVFPGPEYVHWAEHVHGITEAEVRKAPPIGSVLSDLISFIGDRVVVAHNLAFENRFLTEELKAAGLTPAPFRGICTYRAATRLVKDSANHKLGTIAAHFGITQEIAHRALADAEACAKVASKLIQEALKPHQKEPQQDTNSRTATKRRHKAKNPQPRNLDGSTLWSPSREQLAIYDAFHSEGDIKVLAGAGTGKTSTLQYLAGSTTTPITYLAYNQSIAREAQGKFGQHVAASTIHSLAFQSLKSQAHGPLLDRLNLGLEPTRLIAQRLGTTDRSLIQGLGSADLSAACGPHEIALMAMETVGQFCQSDSSQILRKHATKSLERMPASLRKDAGQLVLLFAQEYWDQVVDPRNKHIPISHDHYLKLWLLSKPKISAPGGVLFVDEAQDLSPAVTGFLKRQTHLKKVFVGDSNQAIYGFAGGADALPSVTTRYELPLTISWRFGTEIAEVANKWLTVLGAKHFLQGNPGRASTLKSASQPAATLTRTNEGALYELMEVQKQGKQVALQMDTAYVLDFIKSAEQLKAGRRATHPLLRNFSSWNEVREFVLRGRNDLTTWVSLVESYGTRFLTEAIAKTVPVAPGIPVISTAHKAKGLEWESVQISQDFDGSIELAMQRGGDSAVVDERRLAYVAVTRAQDALGAASLENS